MSYGVSAALQSAVYQRLTADTALAALVGTDIYDTVPTGVAPSTYVSLGTEDVVDMSDKSGRGAVHVFTVSVVTDAAGFQSAKSVAGAISDAILDAELILSRGTLIYLNFEKAAARRVGDGEIRRIDLKFRARVEDN